MKIRTSRAGNKGFTLVEILIAFTLSTIVVLIIFSAFRLSERSYLKVSEREDTSLRLRVLMDRIGWLIRGAYPYSEAYILDPSIKEMSFTYLDPEDGAWYEEWSDEKSYLPSAIKVKFISSIDGSAVEIPEMVFRIQSPYPFIKE